MTDTAKLRQQLCVAIGDSTRIDAVVSVFNQWLANEGLKIVPAEPDIWMRLAPQAMGELGAEELTFADVYCAMIAAAPIVDMEKQ